MKQGFTALIAVRKSSIVTVGYASGVIAMNRRTGSLFIECIVEHATDSIRFFRMYSFHISITAQPRSKPSLRMKFELMKSATAQPHTGGNGFEGTRRRSRVFYNP